MSTSMIPEQAWRFYGYTPSKVLPFVAIALFSIAFIGHVWLAIRRKTTYVSPLSLVGLNGGKSRRWGGMRFILGNLWNALGSSENGTDATYVLVDDSVRAGSAVRGGRIRGEVD